MIYFIIDNVMRVIAIAGMICSGKSFISNVISQKFEIPRTSFGSYIKSYCEENSLPSDRESLQMIGQGFIETDPESFLNRVIEKAIINKESDFLIIDGVRHKVVIDLIRKLYPQSFMIYLSIPLEVRYKRYTSRRNESDKHYSFEGFQDYCNHKVEMEIELLKPLAEIVITQENSASVYKDIYKLILQ